ncbi:predicted protein [Postia placenta Mad-698-R]|nr:predicted protein [Postia placenta Mad-698-R]
MRTFKLSAVLAALLAAPALVGAVLPIPHTSAPTRTDRTMAPNPATGDLSTLALAQRVPMTNAQRLARGLAPNRPRFNHAGAGTSASTFVSRVPNVFGEYGVTTDAANALLVQYANCAGAASADLVTLNGIADFTYLGGITGFSSPSGDLGPGSSMYAYLGGTSQTAPGATPQAVPNSFTFTTGIQEDVESAIWTLDRTTGVLTAHWSNTDRSTPATSIVYYAPENFLLLTGNPAAFRTTYGAGSVVTLTFVEA